MRRLYKNRPRLLVVCSNEQVSHQLETLLSGYDYLVDVERNLEGGYARFKAYRHQVILVDEEFLGKNPDKVLNLFKKIQKFFVFMALVPAYRPNRVEELLSEHVYDVVETPVFPERLHQQVRRVISHQRLMIAFNYLRFVLLFLVLLGPFFFRLY